MKIGIDARMYGPAQGGIGRYLQQLLHYLEELDPPADFRVFLRKDNWDEYQPQNPRFIKKIADIPWYGFKEQIRLPSVLLREHVDLMHFPHWNIPILYRRPFIVTIHDLLLLHYPTREASRLGRFGYGVKYLAYSVALRHAVHKARTIIADSEFTKNDIRKKFGISTTTQVIYPSPLPPLGHTENTANDKILLQAYGITRPYALYVGVAYPHKNLDRLVQAWKLFTDRHGQGYQLVLVGKKNFFYQKLIAQSWFHQTSGIVYTDFIPDDLLPTFYSQASLYVFPSLYEGFGMPPLEAMAYGVPVIASNATCLPEILKDAAYYFAPTDISALAQALWLGFTDKDWRQRLVAAGQKLYPTYNGETLARATWDIYQNSVY